MLFEKQVFPAQDGEIIKHSESDKQGEGFVIDRYNGTHDSVGYPSLNQVQSYVSEEEKLL